MVTPQELLPLGFCFMDGIPESMVYKINGTIYNVITYVEGNFQLGINGSSWIDLNIDNINDIILAIDLFSKNGNTVC